MTNTKNTAATDLILVTGATGKTGRRVTERLEGLGLPVRKASRSAEIPFDWDAPETWDAALAGVGKVYLAYSPDAGFPGAAEIVGAFAERAVAAGASRIVLLTGRGEEGAVRTEEAVRATGADLTVIRAAFFAQNFSEDFLIDAVRSGTVYFPADGIAEPFVDADDIADVAVAALTDGLHIGRTYELTGPRLITFAQAVAEIAAATGLEIAYAPVPLEAFEEGMVAEGAPAEFAALFRDLLAEVLDGRNQSLAHGVRDVLGRAPRDFADYARENAAAWK
ncbi:NmrA family transcriptional regulator [Actinorhabdospora filicis]|nr:NmrA family transcriptional regulator [Actinorhabdospora filicis]